MEYTNQLNAAGHVVQDFYIGNTHVKICDDCCRGQSKEETDAILERIASISLRIFTAEANQESLEYYKK